MNICYNKGYLFANQHVTEYNPEERRMIIQEFDVEGLKKEVQGTDEVKALLVKLWNDGQIQHTLRTILEKHEFLKQQVEAYRKRAEEEASKTSLRMIFNRNKVGSNLFNTAKMEKGKPLSKVAIMRHGQDQEYRLIFKTEAVYEQSTNSPPKTENFSAQPRLLIFYGPSGSGKSFSCRLYG